LVEGFLERSAYHGVQALVYERLHQIPDWPDDIRAALRQQAIDQAIWELRHQDVIAEALAALADAGVRPVLLKGTALAYLHYPGPAQRTRCDTDLIVPVQVRRVAMKVLQALGFVRVLELGELMSYQACMTREVSSGGQHTIDLHWKINNSELLSRLFRYEELLAAARPVPALSTRALAVDPVRALLIACMHLAVDRQAYQYRGDRLIWLYDIHLLALGLERAQWSDLVRLAAAKGLRAVCLDGIEQARARFTTPIAPEVLAALSAAGPAELPAAYLDANHLRRRWIDFWTLDDPLARLVYLRQLAFPPAAYMRERFPKSQVAWLPWLYLRRAVGGLRRRRSALPANPPSLEEGRCGGG
jgi:hypothetical protein